MAVSAKIIADSISPCGERLITMEIELHRFILPEFNTHRCLSRNFQSSRAVPIAKLIKQVEEDPATPVHWGKNQSGMVADGELTGYGLSLSKDRWREASKTAIGLAYRLNSYGVHKQIVNRLLEPFMWTRGVVTATLEGFESFFKLRCHSDAQPEIKALADAMRAAVVSSIPRELEVSDYHLPYVDDIGDMSIEEAIKVSTSCTAQVSYRVLDDSLEKALKVYGMLNLPKNGVYEDDPPHFSPTEHVAKCVVNANDGSGNFHSYSWFQYRKALEVGAENLFMEEV